MSVSNWLSSAVLRRVGAFKAKLSLSDLINAEAIEGGKLFDKDGGHLFVLDDRNLIVEQQYGGTVLDFVYAKIDPKTRQTQYAIVYRVTNTSIDKIYNGRVQSLSVSELQHLMKVIEAYRVMIRDKFYPIDAFLEDPDGELPGDGAAAAAKANALTHLYKLSERALTKL